LVQSVIAEDNLWPRGSNALKWPPNFRSIRETMVRFQRGQRPVSIESPFQLCSEVVVAWLNYDFAAVIYVEDVPNRLSDAGTTRIAADPSHTLITVIRRIRAYISGGIGVPHHYGALLKTHNS
jgi:hypothetical protein